MKKHIQKAVVTIMRELEESKDRTLSFSTTHHTIATAVIETLKDLGITVKED